MKFQKATKLMAAMVAMVMVLGVVKEPVKASGTWLGSYVSGSYTYEVYYDGVGQPHLFTDRPLTQSTLKLTGNSLTLYPSTYSFYYGTQEAYINGNNEGNYGTSTVVSIAVGAGKGNTGSRVVNFNCTASNTNYTTVPITASAGYYMLVPAQGQNRCSWAKYLTNNNPNHIASDAGSFCLASGTAYICCVYRTGTSGAWSETSY